MEQYSRTFQGSLSTKLRDEHCSQTFVLLLDQALLNCSRHSAFKEINGRKDLIDLSFLSSISSLVERASYWDELNKPCVYRAEFMIRDGP